MVNTCKNECSIRVYLTVNNGDKDISIIKFGHEQRKNKLLMRLGVRLICWGTHLMFKQVNNFGRLEG